VREEVRLGREADAASKVTTKVNLRRRERGGEEEGGRDGRDRDLSSHDRREGRKDFRLARGEHRLPRRRRRRLQTLAPAIPSLRKILFLPSGEDSLAVLACVPLPSLSSPLSPFAEMEIGCWRARCLLSALSQRRRKLWAPRGRGGSWQVGEKERLLERGRDARAAADELRLRGIKA